MRNRTLNLNIRVDEDELEKLRALADDQDLSASTYVRHTIAANYSLRFGAKPPRAKKTNRSRSEKEDAR